MLLKMWKIVLIFVSVLCRSNAQEGNCNLDGVEENEWTTSFQNTPVDDFEETEFRRFPAQNIESVEVRGADYGQYFGARLEEGYLVVFPTEAFKNYEIDQESVANPEMNIQLAFGCSNARSRNLAFYQPITDHNTYPPTVQQSSYTYLLPMPLSANFDIAPFGSTIEACDTDISNVRLDFSISPDEDFSVTWGEVVSGSKNKCHTAVIRTKTQLRLTTSKTYEITVTDRGNPTQNNKTALIIEVDEETTLPPNPQFEAAYYIANYNVEGDQHSIVVNSPINLREGCSKLSALRLAGDHGDQFSVACVEEQVVVTLDGKLPDDVLENDPITLITVEADLENAEELGRTVLVVYLPKQECPTTVEPTACPSTVTPTECPVCPTETTTSFTCPPCTTESPSTPTECPPCSTIPPVECTTESATECPPCSTIPPVECTTEPSTECPPCSTTPGECPSTPTECPLTCPPCSTTPGECPSTPTECPLTCPPCSTTPGECPSTPTECPLTCPPCSTTPGECPSTPTECPVSCPTPEFTTECPLPPTTPGECPSASTQCSITCPPCSTTLGASSPATECPVTCPTPEQSTECPPCSTTPAPPLPETSIKFEQDQYSYKIKSWYVGHVVGVVKASVSPKEAIEYSIEPDNGFIECNKETGELSVLRQVDPGTYSFIAYAKGVDTETTTQTIVLAEVIDDDEDTDPESVNSILVIHVDEDEEIDISLPCQYTYCKYTTPVQYPTTDDNIFSIEDNILHVAKIKRERAEIIEMLVPQFALHLFLGEVGTPLPDKTKRSNNSSQIMPPKTNLQTKAIDDEWVFIPTSVPNLPNQLLLWIIIDDINNNAPVFEIVDELIVGYPTAELAVQLTPPYLAKVVATDLDADINAQIRYSTDSSHFIVHPETGVIYPGEDAFDDESNLVFTVTATDKNGAADGLSTDLKIEVKPLRQENLIVLIVKNLMLEDIDDTMQQLSAKTNMKINYLTAAVIPLSNTQFGNPLRQLSGFLRSMMMPRATSDHSSRIIVYGLDTDDEPVETDTLQEVLEEAGVLEDFTIDKWEPEGSSNGGDDDDDPSTAGFIAAIAVLASLLAIFMIAAAAFYYFKIYRPKTLEPYNSMEEEDTNSVNFEKNPRTSTLSKYEEQPQRRVTGFVFNPPPVEEDEDEFGEQRYADTPDYVQPDWHTRDEEEIVENKVRFVDTAKNDLHGESKVKFEDSPTDYDGDQKKSVTFKETVEKINIVVDDRRDEPDDIFNERL